MILCSSNRKPSKDTIPEERINIISGGVNVLVEGVDVDVQGQEFSPGIIDLFADRVVIWTQAGEGDSIEAPGPVSKVCRLAFSGLHGGQYRHPSESRIPSTPLTRSLMLPVDGIDAECGTASVYP